MQHRDPSALQLGESPVALLLLRGEQLSARVTRPFFRRHDCRSMMERRHSSLSKGPAIQISMVGEGVVQGFAVDNRQHIWSVSVGRAAGCLACDERGLVGAAPFHVFAKRGAARLPGETLHQAVRRVCRQCSTEMQSVALAVRQVLHLERPTQRDASSSPWRALPTFVPCDRAPKRRGRRAGPRVSSCVPARSRAHSR